MTRLLLQSQLSIIFQGAVPVRQQILYVVTAAPASGLSWSSFLSFLLHLCVPVERLPTFSCFFMYAERGKTSALLLFCSVAAEGHNKPMPQSFKYVSNSNMAERRCPQQGGGGWGGFIRQCEKRILLLSGTHAAISAAEIVNHHAVGIPGKRTERQPEDLLLSFHST